MILWYAFILAGLGVQAKALPDAESFRKDLPAIVNVSSGGSIALDGTMAHDESLQKYTYKETKTSISLDSNGKTRGSMTEVYEVTRSAEAGQVYRKLISKTGAPLSDTRPSQPATGTAVSRPPRDLVAENNDIQALYDIHVEWSEPVDGHAVIALTLKPKTRYKPKTDLGRWQQHFSIRAWVTAEEHELVRREAVVVSEIRVGRPIKKGTMMTVERRLINGEIWLPVRTELHILGSFMLNDAQGTFVSEFSDFRKFVADVELKP